MTTLPFPILFVGDHQREEFRAAADWLAERGAVLLPDAPAALAAMRDDFTPAVIVVAQPWRGCYPAHDIDRLRRAAPLARIVSLWGSWLEGETRSGKPWPAEQRIYWHQAIANFEQEFDDIAKGGCSNFALPATVAPDERIGAQCHNGKGARLPDAVRPLVAICARHRETADALGNALCEHGWHATWHPDRRSPLPQNANLLLLDFACTGPAAAEEVLQLKQTAGGIPIIALVGFPRISDIRLLHDAGAAAVVSKPFLVHDLLWQIDQLLQPTSADANWSS